MSHQIENVFFSLLRSGMWGSKIDVPHGFDSWKDVARLAKEQAVLGVVAEAMLSDRDIADTLPQELKAKLKTFLMSGMLNHSKVNSVLVKAVGDLRKAGVESVLLKGQGLAVNYPKPELRQCGDIDLYVGKDNYLKAYDILQPSATSIDDRRSLEVGRHFHIKISGVEIEVHRYSETYPSGKLDRIYQKASDKGLSEGLVPLNMGDVCINTPSVGFNSFYIFSHFFYHFLTSGVGLRQISDWVMHLHRYNAEIDLQELRTLIEDMDMMKPWQAFGCVVTSVLGLPREEFPFYDESAMKYRDRILRRVLEEGNFGKRRSVYSGRGKNYFYDKTRSFFAHIARTFRLMMIFPSQSISRFLLTMWDGFAKVISDISLRS